MRQDDDEKEKVNARDQLQSGENFRCPKIKLYLVRCFNCGDAQKGTENYLHCIPEGRCGFCGWREVIVESEYNHV